MSTPTATAQAPRLYVRPEKPPKPKCALVGFCQSSRDLTPYLDNDFEIWGLNKGYIFQAKWDRWFEMHGPGIYKWPIRRPHRHMDFLRAQPIVYLHVADPEIPNSVAFPLKEVADDIGLNVFRLMADNSLESMVENPYLSSSIAYEIALAIHERFEEIHLYGIDLNTGGEYAWQKPGVEFLLGVAAARGIKVVVPDNCALLKGKLYGRGFLTKKGDKVTKSQYEIRLAEVQQRQQQTAIEFHQLTGQKSECEFIINQMPPGIDAEKLTDRFKQIAQAVDQKGAELHQLAGCQKEIMYWISTTPEGQDGKEALQQLADVSPENPVIASDNGHDAEAVKETVEVAA